MKPALMGSIVVELFVSAVKMKYIFPLGDEGAGARERLSPKCQTAVSRFVSVASVAVKNKRPFPSLVRR